MVGGHLRLSGHEFEQAPGDGEGQGSLACCSPWGCKESDTTERLNNKKARREIRARLPGAHVPAARGAKTSNSGYLACFRRRGELSLLWGEGESRGWLEGCLRWFAHSFVMVSADGMNDTPFLFPTPSFFFLLLALQK